jgi:hypothetical protein
MVPPPKLVKVGLTILNFPPVINPKQVGNDRRLDMVQQGTGKQSDIRRGQYQHRNHYRIQALKPPLVKTSNIEGPVTIKVLRDLICNKITRNQ